MKRHARIIPGPEDRIHEASRAIEAVEHLLARGDDMHTVSGHALASLLALIREEMEKAIEEMDALERRLTAV